MVFSEILKIHNLTERASRGIFEVVEYESVAKNDLALFPKVLGTTLTQNLDLIAERLLA